MMAGPRIVHSVSAYVERAVVCGAPQRRGVAIQADRRRLVAVTSGRRASLVGRANEKFGSEAHRICLLL
jgi:hypothetical protein